jgi:hypothetical protein
MKANDEPDLVRFTTFPVTLSDARIARAARTPSCAVASAVARA